MLQVYPRQQIYKRYTMLVKSEAVHKPPLLTRKDWTEQGDNLWRTNNTTTKRKRGQKDKNYYQQSTTENTLFCATVTSIAHYGFLILMNYGIYKF
jgi:hypothetical protein